MKVGMIVSKIVSKFWSMLSHSIT